MSAVMDSDPSVGALPQVVFIPSALHVIEEDVPRAWTKLGFRHRQQSFSAPQRPAHHLGVRQLPAVVADRSPAAVVVEFDAARAPAVAVCQSQGRSGGICCGERARVAHQWCLPEAVAQPVFRPSTTPAKTGAGRPRRRLLWQRVLPWTSVLL